MARLKSVGWDGLDVVAVSFLVVLLVLSAVTSDGSSVADRPLDLSGWCLLLGAFGPLVVARRYPGPVALVVLSITVSWHQLGYANQVVNVSTALAFFFVGLAGTRRLQWALGLLSVVVAVVAVVSSGRPWGAVIDAAGWVVASILLGEVVRSRGRLVERLSERADRAEAEREREAERRVAEERLRIARELHDLLAHTVASIAVQAEVAADALDRSEPNDETAEVRAAVRAIREAGRDAMSEVRATVTVLRGAEPALGTAPAPGVDRIGELLDVSRAAGLAVELETVDGGEPLPSLVELAAFRIVQEALTNVVRHANASQVKVRLVREPASLVVEVADDGGGAVVPPVHAGFGLRGMAERVASLGGSLDVGPGPMGGLAIRARLPVGRVAPSSA